MKILITGAGGFIGKNLKEGLGNKYCIITPRSFEVDFQNADVVQDFLREQRFDVVIHAANVNSTRNQKTTAYDSLDGNLRMFFNLERCKNLFGKMYYFGSGAEYAMEHYIPNMKEEFFGRYIPHDAYGFSKYIMSKVCSSPNNIYDLRLFGVYGKYEEWERRFISNAICRALKGMPITIQKNVYFDYLWVGDLVHIVEWFLNHNPLYKHYNVCSGSRIDLYSLACMVRDELEICCGIEIKESGYKREYTGNNDRLLNEMGKFVFSDWKHCIRELVSFYKQNIDMIDENLLL